MTYSQGVTQVRRDVRDDRPQSGVRTHITGNRGGEDVPGVHIES